ncbi:hsp70-like protein [Histoplasma ohiense]|nr:hsp70-like protein [Histoplasma ohiense (nom. inval.)]
MDSSMNNLLKWSIENSAPTTTSTDGTTPAPAPRSLSPTALHRLLLNAPSDAELMKNAMAAIRSPTTTLDDKLIAFDNFEQLVENLDNANNLGVLGLWEPLVQELEAAEAGRRMMGAWCIGTAVQNNAGAQEMLLSKSPTALSTLFALSQNDPDTSVRRKAIYALSSAIRNHQPAMDVLLGHIPNDAREEMGEHVDASDMEGVDKLVSWLRRALT